MIIILIEMLFELNYTIINKCQLHFSVAFLSILKHSVDRKFLQHALVLTELPYFF